MRVRYNVVYRTLIRGKATNRIRMYYFYADDFLSRAYMHLAYMHTYTEHSAAWTGHSQKFNHYLGLSDKCIWKALELKKARKRLYKVTR